MPFVDIQFVDALLDAALYSIVINLVGFLVLAWDKYCALNQMWRVPERTLLTLAAAGATVGIMVGQRALRHKTRKQPFRTYLLLIAAIQVVLLVTLCFPQGRGALWSLLRQVLKPGP